MAKISLSKHPILPFFQRYAKSHKPYYTDYLCIANNTFVFLYFCVFVFRILTAKCDTTEKDTSSVTQPAVLREDWMRFGIKVNSV